MASAGCGEWARRADGADASRVGELWEAAAAELRGQRGGARLVDDVTPPAELGGGADGGGADGGGADGGGVVPPVGTEDRLVVVAGIDQVTLGFAAADIDRRGPAPQAVVRAVYVEAEARGVGLGEAMLRLVVAWAEAEGCAGVDAYALPGNRPAKAFFEDIGFTARLLTMHRRLR